MRPDFVFDVDNIGARSLLFKVILFSDRGMNSVWAKMAASGARILSTLTSGAKGN